jgi:hypothetical protein
MLLVMPLKLLVVLLLGAYYYSSFAAGPNDDGNAIWNNDDAGN